MKRHLRGKAVYTGRLQRYSDVSITMELMLKRVFCLTPRAQQGFVDSIFTLMKLLLNDLDYPSVSKRANPSISFSKRQNGVKLRTSLRRHLA